MTATMAILKIAGAGECPAPPYPKDAQARGWRFELDLDRIEQSETWLLASTDPGLRPWLLMLWCQSWRQYPAGSLPDDDTLIALRIGMPEAEFKAKRAKLMRGWWKASDGRLYHPVITEIVLAMLKSRLRDRLRHGGKHPKEQAHSGEFRMESDGSAGNPPDSDGSTGTRTRTGTSLDTPSVGKGGPGGNDFALASPTRADDVPAARLSKAERVDLRGSRMQPDDPLPDDWRRWAIECYPKLTPQAVMALFVEFRNYWSDLPGKAGLKLRWFQTWQNNVHRKMKNA